MEGAYYTHLTDIPALITPTILWKAYDKSPVSVAALGHSKAVQGNVQHLIGMPFIPTSGISSGCHAKNDIIFLHPRMDISA